ncbi:MAG: chemotaxis protein CheX [Desulfatirhabdiaceae bacterium]
MNEDLCEVLYDVTGDALEKLAFMFSQRDNATVPLPLNDADSVVVMVAFDGQITGQVVVVAEKITLRELTGNMMGIDDGEIAWDDQKDALKETVNIICGNLLPRIFGVDWMFSILSPTVVTMSELNVMCTLHPPSAAIGLNLDEGRWTVYYFQNP